MSELPKEKLTVWDNLIVRFFAYNLYRMVCFAKGFIFGIALYLGLILCFCLVVGFVAGFFTWPLFLVDIENWQPEKPLMVAGWLGWWGFLFCTGTGVVHLRRNAP